jgi:hypothetical protein
MERERQRERRREAIEGVFQASFMDQAHEVDQAH